MDINDTFNINIATGHVDYRYDVNRGKDVVSVYKNNIHVLTLPCSGRSIIWGHPGQPYIMVKNIIHTD